MENSLFVVNCDIYVYVIVITYVYIYGYFTLFLKSYTYTKMWVYFRRCSSLWNLRFMNIVLTFTEKAAKNSMVYVVCCTSVYVLSTCYA